MPFRCALVQVFVVLTFAVVCGDQSSGKSSVLEAITEIPFPRSSTLCTRFATQLILRRTATTKARVYIIPDSLRKGAEREKLEHFAGVISDFSELPELVEKAKVAMGLNNGDGAFSRDTLSIEVCGPDKPQLTIVDLPGLIHSENRLQSKADVELVSELVHRYMSDQRTIILAVVTAKNDYANQIVLKRAKEADPEGIRTLGIITKPDTLPAGSGSEKDFVNLAKNKDIFFKLGWHVIRNRGYEERDCTFVERNRLEREFFAQGAWAGVDTGIDSLRTRLSNLLLNHIKRELPQVHQEIFNGLRECENELKLLGQRRTTTEEQRTLLFRVSELFGSITKSAVEGTYENPFFGLIEQGEGRKKRLRAHVQALNNAFAEKMRLEGHSRHVVETEEEQESGDTDHPEVITRKQAIEWVRPLLVGGRGRELPGTFNPLLISELFWEQSKDWGKLAAKHLKKVFRRLQEFLRIALTDLAPSEVIDSLFAYHIDTKMAERLEKANRELENLLEDRRRHAITYNHYYTDNVQKIRHDRFIERTARLLENISDSSPVQMTKQAILNALAAPVEADMDDYACQEALDSMLAYYKVR
jgi:GTPase SAR1 family protein